MMCRKLPDILREIPLEPGGMVAMGFFLFCRIVRLLSMDDRRRRGRGGGNMYVFGGVGRMSGREGKRNVSNY